MQHECIECEEKIRNPVCQECLTKELIAWLSETDDKLAMKIISKVTYNNIGDQKCLLCGKKFNMCESCAAKELLEILKEELTSQGFEMFMTETKTTIFADN